MLPQRTDDPTRSALVFNEYEVAICGGLDAIRHQYPGFEIVVTPAKVGGEVKYWRKLNGGNPV